MEGEGEVLKDLLSTGGLLLLEHVDQLRHDPVDAEAPFASVGGDTVDASDISVAFQTMIGVERGEDYEKIDRPFFGLATRLVCFTFGNCHVGESGDGCTDGVCILERKSPVLPVGITMGWRT